MVMNTQPSSSPLPEFLTCPDFAALKGMRHGFFTRQGGVSTGIFGSLNCGYGSDDTAEDVAENRRRVVASLGIPGKLCTLHQAHTNKVLSLTEALPERGAPEADAMVTASKGLVLGILTADCTPVLFYAPKNRVIGAAHAGWKGAMTGILENTVSAMETLGAKRGEIHATLGAAIAQCSYEVGPEFYERFIAEDRVYNRFFQNAKREFHYQFDLPGFVKHRLHTLGLTSISELGRDTCGEPETFFSYRYNTLKGSKKYGRLVSCITLVED